MDDSSAVPAAESKTAPKAYQFIEGRPAQFQAVQDEEKENHPTKDDSKGKDSMGPETDPNDFQPAAPSSQKPFPSTPATRLPLADLIGNAEDQDRSKNEMNPSPEEHIMWHTLRSPKTTNVNTTPVNRKRARSTSPSSSEHPPVKKPVEAGKDSLDLKSLKHTLKTPPYVDPAAELWNRYAIGSHTGALSGVEAASLANLPFPSSPYAADDQAGNVSGLRRWTSCGVEWPSSKSKRRKVTHLPIKDKLDEGQADAQNSAAQADRTEVRESKMGSLLQRIQESLERVPEPTDTKGPSSSSPLPERTGVFEGNSDSPNSPTRRNAAVYEQCHGDDGQLHVDEAPSVRDLDNSVSKEPSSSSFDSEGVDMGVVDDVSKNLVELKSETLDSATREEAINADPTKPTSATEPLLKTQSHVAAPENDGQDEFDEEIDISMEEFDAVASFCGGPRAAQELAKDTRKNVPFPELPIDIGKDDFGSDEFDDASFAAAEAAVTASVQASAPSSRTSDRSARTIQRYLIVNIAEGVYTETSGTQQPEKVLLVEDDRTKINKAIILRGFWFDTRCTKNSFVHVIGEFSATGQCVIDNQHNILILHPDQLISAGVVADSFGCLRRAVLQDRIKATGDCSPPQVYGTMLHEIFQQAMMANRWDTDWLADTISTVITSHLEELYEIKLNEAQATEHLKSKMPELQAWAKVFVNAKPQAQALVKDRNGKKVNMSINKLLDVEEHVWSPMFGLKGNIDATVQVTMQDEEGERTLVVPFEVKTGKNNTNISHRAQTALYTLLLSDRYGKFSVKQKLNAGIDVNQDVAVAFGILYYLETSETSRIPAIRNELLHMIMQRNELACYVRERLSLPPMLKNPHTCNRCYAKTACFLYHKLIENGTEETSGMGGKYSELVKHLKVEHQEFFKNWDVLLTQEETEMMKSKRELWTMLSKEREKAGRCFANVVLEPNMSSEEKGTSKTNRFRYTFRKRNENPAFCFNESRITVGEPIVVSDEKGHYALANGFVVKLSKTQVTVAVDRRLHNARIKKAGFDAVTNQVFTGIMEVEGARSATPPGSTLNPPDEILYRVDKDEFSNGLAMVRNNLVQIMDDSVFHARALRSLIVEGVEPKFKPSSSDYTLSGPQSQMSVNDDQKSAIEKILTAEDYALVLGMPGTGKTTTIAHIIRALVAKGKSVLLTSYTHTAVDNILLKIRADNINILRLGALAKVHHEVRDFAVLASEPKTSMEELQKQYQEPQVVATTCLGINHGIFNERTFDYCIVDEASQITLPVCLGPIRMAKKFILVGDHNQLPPLVQNSEAQAGGLDVSLFKLLSERHPSAVAELHHQYRMNSVIMSISNTLIYGGKLVCGSPDVANRTLTIPNFDALARIHDSSQLSACATHRSPNCWIHRAIGPGSGSVVFLNTDTLLPNSREQAKGSRIANSFEAELTVQTVRALLVAGIDASSIGIITLYRTQLALLKSLLQSSVAAEQAEALEAHTADRFQGRDKEVVLLSCVRSNDRDIVGELLRDWRRVNVSMTRARSKLIIIGSKGTLGRGDELLGKLVQLCEDERWIVDLPTTAESKSTHAWPILPGPPKSSGERRPSSQDAKQGDSPSRQAPQQPPAVQARETQDKALAPVSSAAVNRAFKPPRKVGKVTAQAVLGAGGGSGSSMRSKRPVLADIFHDVVGDPDF